MTKGWNQWIEKEYFKVNNTQTIVVNKRILKVLVSKIKYHYWAVAWQWIQFMLSTWNFYFNYFINKERKGLSSTLKLSFILIDNKTKHAMYLICFYIWGGRFNDSCFDSVIQKRFMNARPVSGFLFQNKIVLAIV